jgi:hypothetical protein
MNSTPPRHRSVALPTPSRTSSEMPTRATATTTVRIVAIVSHGLRNRFRPVSFMT